MPSLHPNRPASFLGIMVDRDPTAKGAICAKVRTDAGRDGSPWHLAPAVTLPTDIEQLVRENFPADAVDEARSILRPQMGSRVLMAVVLLSKGDLTKLRHFSDAAAKDFRDVLYWAEYPPGDDEPKSYEEMRERLHLPPEKGPQPSNP